MKREKQILEIQKVKNSTAKLFLVHRPFLWMKELIISPYGPLKSIRNSKPFPNIIWARPHTPYFNKDNWYSTSAVVYWIQNIFIVCTHKTSHQTACLVFIEIFPMVRLKLYSHRIWKFWISRFRLNGWKSFSDPFLKTNLMMESKSWNSNFF